MTFVPFVTAAPDHDYAISFEQLPAVSQTFIKTHFDWGTGRILPAPIITYLSSSFAQVPVEKVKKGFRYAYELELVNDLELKFNSKGVCRKIDD